MNEDFNKDISKTNNIIYSDEIINNDKNIIKSNLKIIQNNSNDMYLNLKYNDSYNNDLLLKENSNNDTLFSYVLNLFIQYFESVGINVELNTLYKYLRENNICEVDQLLKSNGEFVRWLKVLPKMSEYYTDHVDKLGINLDHALEINKGQFDSASISRDNVVSKYANTFNLENAILRKCEDKLYISYYDNGNEVEVPEGSTFLMHNCYSEFDFIYIINTLAGTNNELVIGNWGVDSNINKNRFKKTLKLLNYFTNEYINYSEGEKDGIYCGSVIVNTKKLKKLFDDDSMYEKELSLVLDQGRTKVLRRG